MDNQKAVLASDRAKPNVTANVRFYFEFITSMFLKREDLVPWDELRWHRKLTRQIIAHPWFNRFIISIVLVNCVVMSLYHYNMSTTFANTLEVSFSVAVQPAVLCCAVLRNAMLRCAMPCHTTPCCAAQSWGV